MIPLQRHEALATCMLILARVRLILLMILCRIAIYLTSRTTEFSLTPHYLVRHTTIPLVAVSRHMIVTRAPAPALLSIPFAYFEFSLCF